MSGSNAVRWGVFVFLVVQLFVAVAQAADVRWVSFATAKGERVQALYAASAGAAKVPAVIYNHGTGVRHSGYAGAASRHGMDVKDFVEALAKEGYVAIAPIREFLAGSAYMEKGRPVGSAEDWSAVIENGIEVTVAAVEFLKGQAEVDRSAIGIVGYSEGGNVALWSATRHPVFRAVVLLAPASINMSAHYNLRKASSSEILRRITAPVYLAVGQEDLRPIRADTQEVLIPNLSAVNSRFVHKTDYPGGHFWFYRVRPEFWNDVTAFLKQHLR